MLKNLQRERRNGRGAKQPPGKKAQAVDMSQCQCGCGTKIPKYDKNGNVRRFVLGHNHHLRKIQDEFTDPNFLKTHESFVQVAKAGNADLLFLGDSITAGWRRETQTWATAFGAYKAANFGIGGDRTQHVLWRITNGELEGITPKAVVLMIGTNNSGSDPAEEIAKGITKIVETITAKSPNTKVLLLAIFPRGEKPNPAREKIKKVNTIIAKLHDGQKVFFMDIGDKFLQPDETISRDIMPDFLHLSAKGYKIWADAITPKVAELMK